MTSAKKIPVDIAVVSGPRDYCVVVSAHSADGTIESYASYKQKHIGFFADDPANDPPELVHLRPWRDILLGTMHNLLAMKGTST